MIRERVAARRVRGPDLPDCPSPTPRWGGAPKTAKQCRVLLALLAAAGPAQAVVEVNVTRVGFSTLSYGNVVRAGVWVPVVVDVALVDQQQFDGFIRVGQFDNDGDECYDRVDVHLRAETGGSQRIYLYALANPQRNQGRLPVELFDQEGKAVRVLSQGELTYQARPAQQPEVIDHDDILILSLSSRAIGRLHELAASNREDLYARPLHVGHMNPADLPELWIGLEAVDYIVWDDARPEELAVRQVNALLEWVRQGGTLLVAASRTADSLRFTEPLYAALPVDLGRIILADNLPEVRKRLLDSQDGDGRSSTEDPPWWEIPFDTLVPVVETTLREGAVQVIREGTEPYRTNFATGEAGNPVESRDEIGAGSGSGQTSANVRVSSGERSRDSGVVARRRLGRGHVIFSSVVLRDLFREGGNAVTFFRELFHLNVLEDPDEGRPRSVSLFPQVVSAIAFARSGSLYLGMAVVFSAGYVLLATFGLWGILGTRGWRQHSWSAFALAGVTASLLSVLAVNALRGFGETLHQISIVDLEAGSAYGYATAFFGLKTGTDRRLDLWLPSDPLGALEPGATNCFLRPLPSGTYAAATSTSYADPEGYRLAPASAVVSGVRIRATLKRFEGRWAGFLGGTVTGNIAVKGIQILEGSYLASNLGVDLKDCYLLHTVRDLSKDTGPRGSDIYAFHIGDVPSDGSRIDLRARCYRAEGEEPLAQILTRSTLAEAQNRWSAEFRSVLSNLAYGWETEGGLSLGQEKNALLLVSTAGEHDPARAMASRRLLLGPTTWSRDRLRRLDLREDLRRDTAVLIGFADDPGPVRLFRRAGDRPYRMLKPDPKRSWTMYRIMIPVTLHKTPSEEGKEEKTDERVR